jgi:hypothetical protein
MIIPLTSPCREKRRLELERELFAYSLSDTRM